MSWFVTLQANVVVGGMFRARQNEQQVELDDDDPRIIAYQDENEPWRWSADRILRQRNSIKGTVPASQADDFSTTSTSYVDVPDAIFELEANKRYAFRFNGHYFTGATQTGLHLAMNGPTFTKFNATFNQATTLTTILVSPVTAYDVGGNATASLGASLLPFWCEGVIITSGVGQLRLRAKSETGTIVTIPYVAGQLFPG